MRLKSLVTAVALLASAVANAQEPKLQLTLDSPLFSKYVWRGLDIVDGPVWQPSLTAETGAWSLSLWGNFELDDTNVYAGFGSGRGKFTELDTTLAFSANAGAWSYSTGFVRYDLPNTGAPKTGELFAIATHDSEWSPTLGAYADVDAAKGEYFNVGASRALDHKGVSYNLGAGIGFATASYNSYYFSADKAAFVDFSALASATWAVSASSSFTLYGGYSSLLDRALVPGSGKRDSFVLGAGITFGF